MKKIVCICLLIGLAACKSRKIDADSDNKYVIEALARTATGENLSEIYPDARIEEGTAFFEEGTEERLYSMLYPNTNDALLITWEDAERTEINNIRVEKQGRWRSATGIQVGTPYEKIVEINKAPISIYGFGWDYSGAVDYEGGKLDDTNIRVFLAPQNEAPGKFYGDKKIEASKQELENLDLKVRAILYQEFE